MVGENHPRPGLRAHCWLRLLFTLYGLFAFCYSLLVPMWEAPDETAHYLVVLTLAREDRMPTPDETYESGQPPLYYWLASRVFKLLNEINPALIDPYRPRNLTPQSQYTRYQWTDDNYRPLWGARLLRWLNIPLGGLALFFICRGARRFSGSLGQPGTVISLATVTFIGLTPQFLYNSAAISNDPLANAAGGVLFWLLSIAALTPPQGPRLLLMTAAALTFPLLIKLTILPVSVTLLLVILWQLRHFRRWPWLTGGLLLSLLLLVALIWLAPESARFLGRTVWQRIIHIRPDFFQDWPLWEITSFYVSSYWGQIGWKTAGLPKVVVAALTSLASAGWLTSLRLLWPQPPLSRFWRWLGLALMISLLAWAIAYSLKAWWRVPWSIVITFLLVTALVWWRHRQQDPVRVLALERTAWTVVWLTAVVALIIVVKNMFVTPQYQARFLFPSLGALSLPMTAGWYVLLPTRTAPYLPYLLLVTMVAVNLLLWLGTVIPIFYQPFLG